MAEIVFTVVEIKEMRAACGARLRELDKGFKACIKAGVQEAAEKVAMNVSTVRNIEATLKEYDEQ